MKHLARIIGGEALLSAVPGGTVRSRSCVSLSGS